VLSRRTTISCRCFARIALLLALSVLFDGGRPAAVNGQILPDTVQWSVASAAPPSGAPIVAGGSLVIPLRAVGDRAATITAHSLSDGAERWSVMLAAEKPLAADADRIYVADAEAIHALRAKDGRVAWRAVAGRPITAPPLAHAGWVIVAAAGHLIAIRAADGEVLWRKPLGPIEFRPALDGDLLVVSLVDGRLMGLDLKDGSERWTTDLRSSPGEPFVIGGRVYVATQNKIFYALFAESGRIEDHPAIGAPLRGRVAVDDRRVYMAGLDNMLRVVRRDGGALVWQESLVYRPAAGPVLIGNTVIVPGLYVETPLPAFAVEDGASAGTVGFDGALVALPVFTTLPDQRLAAVGITGGLDNKWTVSLRTPSLVRAIAAQPLTVLPGEAVPIPQPAHW
jgi:outer membrane protein assembly factor BamB